MITFTIEDEFTQEAKEEFKEILLENIPETLEVIKLINNHYFCHDKYPCIYKNTGKNIFEVVCNNDFESFPYLIEELNSSDYNSYDDYFIFNFVDYKLTSYNKEELKFNLTTLIDDIVKDMIKYNLSLRLDDSKIKELKKKKEKELRDKGKLINKYVTLTRLERDKQFSYFDYAIAEIIHEFE